MSSPRRKRHFLSCAALLLGVMCLVSGLGCASTSAVQQELAVQMRVGDYAAALRTVERERTRAFGGRNELLYHLERGMLLHLDGAYAESNAAFREAKRLGDRLYTESISDIGFSLIANDYAQAYAGENFERTLIHLFSALNYAALDQPDSALVEVRQVGDYLRKLQVDSSNANTYQEDAFARYLSALFYESAGELDSAFVDYKKALAAYDRYHQDYRVGRPASLIPDAERVAHRLGQWARQDLGVSADRSRARLLPEDAGEIVILHYNGLAPVKDQTRYTIPFIEAWPLVLAMQASADPQANAEISQGIAVASQIRGVDLVPVVFPKFVDRSYSITKMRPRVAGALEIVPPELVEDIGAIARKDLADRIVRVRTKAIARAAIKFALQKAAEIAAREAAEDNKRQGDLFALATQVTGNIARFASEQADKRVWSTLPDEIWMSTLVLPAGAHDVQIDFLNSGQRVIETRSFPDVKVAPGRRRFLMVRTVQ